MSSPSPEPSTTDTSQDPVSVSPSTTDTTNNNNNDNNNNNVANAAQTKEPNPIVFFDIEISGYPAGRIEMTLYADVTPKTCENFLKLCTHENNTKGSKDGRKMGEMVGFRCSHFTRAQKQYCIAGDYKRDGLGASAFPDERFFDCENFTLSHDAPGLLSMTPVTLRKTVNPADNAEAPAGEEEVRANGSLFMITNRALPSLDGKQVVFGKVTHGMEVVDKICTECAFQAPAVTGTSKSVAVVECGRLA